MAIGQGKAFRSKFWLQHIDSQHAREATDPELSGESNGPDTILGHLNLLSRTTSRDPDPQAATVPFKERIRPGMVVVCTPPKWIPGNYGSVRPCMVMVLSLASAVGSNVQDFEGKLVNHRDMPADDVVVMTGDKQQYLCAIVTPGLLSGTYEIDIWRHVVVSVEAMEKEVILEYDAATRYYYIAI